MYEAYLFRPQDRPPELNHGIGVVQPFLQDRQPYLHAVVREAHLALAWGRVAEHPHAIVRQALRDDVDSRRLCSVLTGPWADAVLFVIAFEFPMPGMRLLLDFLPPAARAICAERQRNDTVAVGMGALMAGGLLLLKYFSSKDRAA
jgi:hypothetical protein